MDCSFYSAAAAMRETLSGSSFLKEAAPSPLQRMLDKHNDDPHHCADSVVRYSRPPLSRPERNLSTASTFRLKHCTAGL